MHYFITAFTKKYADFHGRASRKEYWMFTMWYSIILILFELFLWAMMLCFSDTSLLLLILRIIFFIFVLCTLIPALAICIRRYHDIGKSWVWCLIYYIPVIGIIWVLVMMCTKGDSGPNQFGEEPQD